MQYLWAILIYSGVALGVRLVVFRPVYWDGIREEARWFLHALLWPFLAFAMIFDFLAPWSERLAVFLLWAGGGFGLYLNLCPPVPRVWFWVSYFLAFFAMCLWAVIATLWASLPVWIIHLKRKLRGKRQP